MYQPALLPRQIRALYLLKTYSGEPMTRHARRAVDDYLRQFPEIRRLVPETEPREQKD